MLIDTHCHLDAAEFDRDRNQVLSTAFVRSVAGIVIPSIGKQNFQAVAKICQLNSGCFPAYGIHPLYVDQATFEDINVLASTISDETVAIGEIGLDYFVQTENKEKQRDFYIQQLELARTNDLPVILHIRKAVDAVLYELRKTRVPGGIAHAFNGSLQQADAFIKMGFALGFGGAMTYSNAHHIRRLAVSIPLEHIVLETDAPDIPPEWRWKQRNEPGELLKIAEVLAELRQQSVEEIISVTGNNALRVLPGLKKKLKQC